MKKLEEHIAAVEQLRNGPVTSESTLALRKAIANRNNYLAGKAAQAAAALGIIDLVADMAAAFDRFLRDCVKTDPQCWGKNALVQALADLAYDDPALYLRGLRHVQMEPVWGGQTDTAGALRGKCAQALVSCRSVPDTKLLSFLLELLVDPDQTVRVEAARAIGRTGRDEAALLLRLKALAGDAEPEVTSACLSGGCPSKGKMLSISSRDS